MKRIETPKLDVTKYVGTKAEIVSAEVINSKFGAVIKVETNPIKLIDGDKLPEGKLLTGSTVLGLIERNGKFVIGIDSKADKFLQGHNVNIEKDISDDLKVGDRIKVLDGKPVVLQKNNNGFLEIA